MPNEESQISILNFEATPVPTTGDAAGIDVIQYLANLKDFQERVAALLRRAFDEVIDGDRTGRWAVEDLKKTEKTYIGTKVEILFRHEFKLSKGKLDLLIDGHDVDVKFSLDGGWMIAGENVGQVCLLPEADEQRSRFSVGVVRAGLDILGAPNRDQKRCILRSKRNQIHWIVNNQPYSKNLLLHLSPQIRERILSRKYGQRRVNELLRLVQKQVIPRSAICTLGQQKDPMRRLRSAKRQLAAENISVICGRYLDKRAEA
jgi:hypothetical protein